MHRCEPTQKRQQVMGRLLSQFIDRVFDGSSTCLVQQLTGARMSDEELDQIKAIINRASQAEA